MLKRFFTHADAQRLALPALPVLALAVALGMPCRAQADPVTIDFEGVVANNGSLNPATPYLESGYTLTANSAGGTLIYGPTFNRNYVTNGSAMFGFCTTDTACGGTGGATGLVLTIAHATPFDFLGLSLATLLLTPREATTPNFGHLLLVGTLAGGGTVSTTLDATSFITDYAVDDFVNLSSVSLTGFAGPDGNAVALSIDNLMFDTAGTTAAVPEPWSLGLAGTALAALAVTSGISRRNNRSNSRRRAQSAAKQYR